MMLYSETSARDSKKACSDIYGVTFCDSWERRSFVLFQVVLRYSSQGRCSRGSRVMRSHNRRTAVATVVDSSIITHVLVPPA